MARYKLMPYHLERSGGKNRLGIRKLSLALALPLTSYRTWESHFSFLCFTMSQWHSLLNSGWVTDYLNFLPHQMFSESPNHSYRTYFITKKFHNFQCHKDKVINPQCYKQQLSRENELYEIQRLLRELCWGLLDQYLGCSIVYFSSFTKLV